MKYKLGVKIDNKIKWLNLYKYKYKMLASYHRLRDVGFKKKEIITREILK